MDTVALLGVILASAAVATVIRDVSKTTAVILTLASFVTVFACVVLRAAKGYEMLKAVDQNEMLSPYVNTMLKGLGIAYLTSFTEGTCREMGFDGCARIAELVGRCDLVLLALPIVLDLYELAGRLIL